MPDVAPGNGQRRRTAGWVLAVVVVGAAVLALILVAAVSDGGGTAAPGTSRSSGGSDASGPVRLGLMALLLGGWAIAFGRALWGRRPSRRQVSTPAISTDANYDVVSEDS